MGTIELGSWRRNSWLDAVRDRLDRKGRSRRPGRSITVTACRRPGYLRQVVESLRENDTDGYVLYMAVEPKRVAEVLEVAREAGEFVETRVLVNRRRLGVRENPYNLLWYVFEHEGSEGNVYLEEDTIVSPDALRLASWYLDEVDKTRLLSLVLFNGDGDPQRPHDLFLGSEFHALGLVLTREQWRRWYRPFWHDDGIAREVFGPFEQTGWDWAMRAVLRRHPELRTLTPCLGRSNHIGRERGVHCTPEFHDANFAAVEINRDPRVSSYRIDAAPRPTRP